MLGLPVNGKHGCLAHFVPPISFFLLTKQINTAKFKYNKYIRVSVKFADIRCCHLLGNNRYGVWIDNQIHWTMKTITTTNYSAMANSCTLKFLTVCTKSSKSPIFILTSYWLPRLKLLTIDSLAMSGHHWLSVAITS
jgi:hypothetical protein